MKVQGKDIEDGVRAWFVEEIKKGPAAETDLGKFFLTASSGTMGILLLAAKMDPTHHVNAALMISFTGLAFATLLSVVMVIPKNWEVHEDTDLQEKRLSIVRRIIRLSYAWFASWAISLGIGVYATLS